MPDYAARSAHVSVETTVSSEGVATTVYLHIGEDALVLEESWKTWDELEVEPADTPQESIVSDMHGVTEESEALQA